MDNLYVQTPILESTPLTKSLGVPVYFKMESMQPTGSYKDRGLAVLLAEYVSKGLDRFVTATLGNAGLSIARSCRVLKKQVKVVVPTITDTFMIDKMSLEGAEVIVHGANFATADAKAKEIAHEEHRTYLDPHNDPLIFEGISTIIYEIFGAGLKPGVIVLPVGCGELLVGVLKGLEACEWGHIPIIAVEPESHCPFANALFTEEKHASSIIPQVFTQHKNHVIYPQIVTDDSAILAGKTFANEARILIEPQSAAALAVVYQGLPILKTFSSVLCIVSGGANVNLSTYR
jgi:L-serine/L-threonine ammonia-lyase